MTTEAVDAATDADITQASTLLDGGQAAPAGGDTLDNTEGDKSADADAGADQDKAKDGEGDKPQAKAPEKYELALDDGQALDADALEIVEPVLRELDLDNDQANALAKKWPELQAKLAERFAATQEEAVKVEIARQSKEWEDQSRADKEIGGADEVMKPKLAKAAAALERFASPELRQLLTNTRLGNHPEVIRCFYRVGEMISEQAPVRGETAAPQPKSTAELMYPTMAKAGG